MRWPQCCSPTPLKLADTIVADITAVNRHSAEPTITVVDRITTITVANARLAVHQHQAAIHATHAAHQHRAVAHARLAVHQHQTVVVVVMDVAQVDVAQADVALQPRFIRLHHIRLHHLQLKTLQPLQLKHHQHQRQHQLRNCLVFDDGINQQRDQLRSSG